MNEKMEMKFDVTVTSLDEATITEFGICSIEELIDEIASINCDGFSNIEIRRK